MSPEGDRPATDPFEALRALPLGTHVALLAPDGHRVEGWLLPPDSLSSPRVVKLKVASGYNLGIRIDPRSTFELLPGPPWGEERTGPSPAPPSSPGTARGSPSPGTVALLTTGGTIASKIDYVTGGVHPVKDPQNLESLYPGIGQGGALEVRAVAEILSEDMSPEVWSLLAKEVVQEFQHGVRGVVVAQGTDTLAYTSAALAFALRDLPGPVVLVGAQRSIDRPSSDGVANIIGAVRVAREADLGEVVVVMHAGPSDDVLAIHRGTRVRKMHSTRRDAFHTLNGPPLGRVDAKGIHLHPSHHHRHAGPARAEPEFGKEGTLLWFHPGLSPEDAEAQVARSRGVIVAGTGMGHVATIHLPWIQRATERGVVVGMTTQCQEGEVDPFVYSRGRELLRAGVAYLGDISPETAYVKLLWALGRSRDPAAVRELLLREVAGEYAATRGLLLEGDAAPKGSP
ncbi:MAG: Glu-tRNA(Gln) amidotransferase subunit GatD [Euryarchaeota archaeon]|nr:Glu-tRNA(Gln) amidotransferase subunit GatD [Euryarchaeota archaeon]MDE1835403.1 Glu-tRNA(Gln) amidotransferase subunit GatD [Euryarchaeota archaeon]MDE1879539.1 Glu-tRNA(Gln) amidotransferase subunit GatD [Euryarchaeota archaeon]MDE2043699.1 Glu-tRNA(Gln) amidotransferase subunit GatD [Thermoplasmata archaeon]